MEQSSIKQLVRLVLETQDYDEFKMHLTNRGAKVDAIPALWEHYRFLHDSSFLKPWVRDCLLEGIKLENAASKHGFSVSKVRTDVYRTTQDYMKRFPFDIYEEAFVGNIT